MAPDRPRRRVVWPLTSLVTAVLLLLFARFSAVDIFPLRLVSGPRTPISNAAAFETCSWKTLQSHTALLDVPPIARSDFIARQRVLASALRAARIDAFVAEPSASSTYYANISAAFHLSERPFLMIIDSDASFSYLVPQFEIGRINVESQHMVFDGDTEKAAIPWAEEENPYAVLAHRLSPRKRIMVDEHLRHMIAGGLEAVGIEVVPMSDEVRRLRTVKTESEIAILKGINGFTRQLVRALQGCLHVGLTQEDVVDTGRALFARAGVEEGFWAIALFGPWAAYPHGGKSGAVLRENEFVLIDIGSQLHGYGSDVTRTILPPGGVVSDELMEIWQTVRRAQTAGFEKMRPNETCRSADAASRIPVKEQGYGPYYTHRLGHGLGLEVHEHPYLNGANHERLAAGVVVTNEPGIYVTNEQAKELGKSEGFGVRLEDPILVTENGGVPLTGRRAESPWDP
ncbi:Creatinase/aminopeptidase [Xylaria bambusicola]|uniref:Creatinase/aminopeptidase n=1 Tax=Xylaria bambusicola TaxID=326684 RepID=UPI00200864F8|nr:Creatinase/aminopeptidase [Xylaria bambusicola]KAI0522179.1 Creatinase/aminopeptidase [Xylaria bambusicola]